MRLRNIPGADERVRNHPAVISRPEKEKGKWQQIFGNEHPIFLEIGMGKGQFLLSMAKKHQNRNFVGVERYASVLVRGLELFDEQKKFFDPECRADDESALWVSDEYPTLTNVRFLCMDAISLDQVFASGEVEGIYLNFSDPWPKARHEKRRLTSQGYLAQYTNILVPQGRLEMKTDNLGLFEFSMGSVASMTDWEVVEATLDLHKHEKMREDNIMTEYEEKFSSMGHPIYKMVAGRKVSDQKDGKRHQGVTLTTESAS